MLPFFFSLLFHCSRFFAPSLPDFCSPCTAPSVAHASPHLQPGMCPFCSVRCDSILTPSLCLSLSLSLSLCLSLSPAFLLLRSLFSHSFFSSHNKKKQSEHKTAFYFSFLSLSLLCCSLSQKPLPPKRKEFLSNILPGYEIKTPLSSSSQFPSSPSRRRKKKKGKRTRKKRKETG